MKKTFRFKDATGKEFLFYCRIENGEPKIHRDDGPAIEYLSDPAQCRFYLDNEAVTLDTFLNKSTATDEEKSYLKLKFLKVS